jgi:hypothetical protein
LEKWLGRGSKVGFGMTADNKTKPLEKALSKTDTQEKPKKYTNTECPFWMECMVDEDENDGIGCNDCVHNFEEIGER